MAQQAVEVVVRWRWWFRIYLESVGIAAAVTGREPNWDRVEWWIRRGLVIRTQQDRR